MRVSAATKQKIMDKLTMSEVAADYCTLIRRNGNNWVSCPFHEEKTPSMILHDDTGTFYCFGCQESGSMFDFVMKQDKLSFPEAVEKLARKAGVPLEEETQENRDLKNDKNALLEIYELLAKTFTYILNTSHDKGAVKAREYLDKRKVSFEIREKFRLGYAPNDWNFIRRFLKDHKYSDEILRKSGLFSKEKEAPYFVDRLMFPILSSSGKVIAFSGRRMSGDEKFQKYINSSDSLIYSKGRELFGISQAIPTLKKAGERAIICEGNFDVMALHQAGMSNAVAVCGTAFTAEHIKLLRRYVMRIDTLFDTDKAGVAATEKALVLIQRAGLENNVVSFEGAKDCSELLEEAGEEGLRDACSHTVSGFNYLVQKAVNQYDTRRPEGKLRAVSSLSPYLDATDSEIVRQSEIKLLAEVLGLDEQTITNDYMKGRSERVLTPSQTPRKTEEEGSESLGFKAPVKETPEIYLMKLLCCNRGEFARFRREFSFNDLEDETSKRLYAVLVDAANLGIEDDELFVQSIEDEALRTYVNSWFRGNLLRGENCRRDIDDGIARLTLRKRIGESDALLRLIKLNGASSMSSSELNDLLLEKKSIDDEIAGLRRRFK